ncbi:MAG TPA: TIGR04076 family protein [Candidatus Blautia faecavium]|uniref:TIGR04076 family protein n=1 Tax=Candidatus Blautia faecavium TaxID=2838487 RepID=A0A9D2RWD1_9FIRM|nr:TIGR04076 family protein [Candidatus Blautia faecavium]
MKKPEIQITLIDRKGSVGCHRGHNIGDTWDYDTEGGKLCPMAMHTLFPMIDILRYGGTLPLSREGDIRFCCPDADVINIFRLEVKQQKPPDATAPFL